MTAEIIVQLIVSGLALGFIYALVSIEYTIIFNATGLLNFSHDKLIMLGAYVFAGQFVVRMGAAPAVAVIATVATMFLFGVLVATGIFIGILENLSTLVIPTLYKDCVAFVLLIVFLLVKPSGLLGHRR